MFAGIKIGCIFVGQSAIKRVGKSKKYEGRDQVRKWLGFKISKH